jgi:beta-lactamase regulating signal transducer with metallopeptidase domain
MMVPVLLDSAVRSLLLGCAVWVLLKLARLRDTGTETAIWTAVLIAALSMPLLSAHVPGLVLRLPQWSAEVPAGAAALELPAGHWAAPARGLPMWPALKWHAYHGPTCLMAAYLVGFCVCAIRLALGLLLTVRLYWRSQPVRAAWAESRHIRVAAEIRSPVSLAGTILLPADHGDWSAAKRNAVLAHEEAHIARGDFFVQLAALIHCALFWFSPFAWWLQTKLAEIAETASDEAAVRRLNDPATYAEILVDVSRRAQKSPLLVAMANSSFIEQRIEHILSEAPTRRLGAAQRMLSVALLAVLAIAVAGAKTALDTSAVTPRSAVAPGSTPRNAATPPNQVAKVATPPAAPASRIGAVEPAARSLRAPRVVAVLHGASSATEDSDDRSYNPRALLDRVYTPKPNYVPAATIVHAGREFYIRSSEQPVADVSVTYAMDRGVH